MSAILFDATRPVNPISPTRRFGAGLFAYVPTTRVDHPAAAEAEYAEMRARELAAQSERRQRAAARRRAEDARRDQQARELDAHLEAKFAEYLAMGRVESGPVC